MKALNSVDIEIIRMISEGLTHKEISEKMRHTVPTIETYRYRLFRKLGVKNAPHCISWAFRNKVLN